MARTIADVQLIFETIAGYDDGDPCSAPVHASDAYKDDDRNLKSIGVGFFDDDGRTPVTLETRNAVKSAATLLSQYGFQVEPFRPDGLEESRQLWTDFFVTAGRMIIEPTLRGREAETSPILREFMDAARANAAHSGDSLLAAWLGRDAVREKVLAQMREYPILLCPVAAIPAFHHGERQWDVEGATVKYLDAWSYCEWFNLLGFPAAVVPMALSSEGLPIGVQVVGRPWQEELVLAVAAQLEEMRGPWGAPPLRD